MTSNPTALSAVAPTTTTDAAAGAALSTAPTVAATTVVDFSRLDPCLRFIEIEAANTGNDDNTTTATMTRMIRWPCLLFDNYNAMTSTLSGSSFKHSFLFPALRSRQVITEMMPLLLAGQFGDKSALPIAFLLGDLPPLPPSSLSANTNSSNSASNKSIALLPRVIFAPCETRLFPIDDALFAFSAQLDLFLHDAVNGKFLQSALQEMMQIMSSSSPSPQVMLMTPFQESSTTVVASRKEDMEEDHMETEDADCMEIENDSIKPAAAVAAPPKTTTTAGDATVNKPPAVTAAATTQNVAAAAVAGTVSGTTVLPPTGGPTNQMAALAAPGVEDSFQNLLPTWESTTTTNKAAPASEPAASTAATAAQQENGGSSRSTSATKHAAAATKAPAPSTPQRLDHSVVTTTTTDKASSASNKSSSQKDEDDDDMPMADNDEQADEQAATEPSPLDDQVAKNTTTTSSCRSNKRTDSGGRGGVASTMDASSAEKESVLVAATRPTSSHNSESVLVQSTRSGTSTRQKASRPKKNSTSSSTTSKTKTPSQPATRSRRNSLTPSNLAFGKLGGSTVVVVKTSTSSSQRKAAGGPSETNTITLRSFSTIQELLQKGGYFFDANLYCRPFMNPRTNPKAVLGRDYFDSLQDFRQDLCAYGVDDYPDWTKTERETIQTWVRLTVVKSVNLDKDDWPEEHDSLSQSQALRILQDQLEFRRDKTTVGTEAWYLPGVQPREGVLGTTMFLDERSLWDHLYRFGLSTANTSRANVNDRDLISLEMFLSQPNQTQLNTFERISPVPMDNAASGSGRSSRKKRLSVSSSAGSLYAASTSAPSASASDPRSNSKKRTIETSSLVPSKKHSSTRAHAAAKTPHPPIAGTWTAEDSPPPASTVMNFHNSTSTVVTADSFSPRESRTIPVIQGTDKERLLTCIEALNQTNEVDHFSYGNGESRFEQNLNHVMTFLNAAITTQGEHGGHPGDPTALYICGVPGIGKTSGVKWCCNKMIQEVEKGTIRVEGNWTPLLCEVNATRLQNVQNPLKELIESMSKALGLSKISMSNVERKLKQGGLLILVVDEIDTLVSSASKRGNSGKLSGRERVVQKLLEWTSDDNMGLAVIGISNSTGNDKFCRLQELGKFKETLTFNAYGVQDIIGILEGRIGRSVMDKNAMEFIGRKISNESGDARQALKLAAKAIQICLDTLPEKGDKTTPGPLVKTMHAHLANRSTHERLNERIGGLPTFTKGVLCVLSALGHEDAISVTCGRLRGFCASCMSHENDIPTAEDFRVSIETLVEMGLLRMDKVHARRAFGFGASIMALDSAPLRLGVQSEDVESAIIQELGQTPFFMRMRELALEKREELLHGSE